MSITQSNNVDDYSHNVPRSQLYPLCNYLEKLNDNKKSAAYQIRKKKTKHFSFTKKVLQIHSLSLNQKQDLFFLNNNRFIEVVFNLQQWVHHFSHNCFSQLQELVPRSSLYLAVFWNDLYYKFCSFQLLFFSNFFKIYSIFLFVFSFILATPKKPFSFLNYFYLITVLHPFKSSVLLIFKLYVSDMLMHH